MNWVMRKAGKQYTCILCRETIPIGEEHIHRYHPGLDTPVSPPHKTTWEQWPTCFHKDCFKNLRRRFNSAVAVYELKDDDWEEVQL